jgi:CRISPR-associated protein Csb2
MADFLRISVRYLQPLAHGRTSGGEPEWPPSPLRLFQAIVAGAAAKFNERDQLLSTVPALTWLENCPLECIIADSAQVSQSPAQFYVPDNSSESLVPAWKRGETNAIPKRTEKVIRPVHLASNTVHFEYRLPDGICPFFDTIHASVRSITHLGWGIDVVVADANLISEQDAANELGERWRPVQSGGVGLRIPVSGTLHDLMRKHTDSLNRLTEEGFHPVPPLRLFEVRRFRKDNDDESRPFCVFQILKPDTTGLRAFNAATRTRDIAAWIRHAVADVCKDWADLASFVHGHGLTGGANRQANSAYRFQYLPLPTINSALKRVESIRRVMVVAPVGCQDRIDFIRRRLLGHELKWNDEVVGVLNLLTGRDYVRDQYVGPSELWSTVTPVILDGFDDQNPLKTEKLLRKALFNAKLVRRVDFDNIEMDWSPFGFLSGIDSSRQFLRPEKLNGTMLHVRLRFPKPINGPIVIGAGRYRGFGLMARTDEFT